MMRFPNIPFIANRQIEEPAATNAGETVSRANARPFPKALCVLGCAAALAIACLLAGCSGASPARTEQPEGPSEAFEVIDRNIQPVTFTVTMAGDCILGTDERFGYDGSLPAKWNEVQDPSYFLSNVQEYFATDDLTIVNFEGTLTESTTREDKEFAFKGPAEYVQILTSGSVEAAAMANNHSADYGEQSYWDTINTLESNGIPTFGYDRIAYMDVQGAKVALISCVVWSEDAYYTDQLVGNIRTAKEQGADVVICFNHWGEELDYVPNWDAVNAAHLAVDAGADLVVGSHPHVVQGYEWYHDRPIAYSTGNFCFGGNSNPADYDCYMVRQTFTVNPVTHEVTLGEFKIIPCRQSSVVYPNDYRPTPCSGEDYDRLMAKIEDISRQIGS